MYHAKLKAYGTDLTRDVCPFVYSQSCNTRTFHDNPWVTAPAESFLVKQNSAGPCQRCDLLWISWTWVVAAIRPLGIDGWWNVRTGEEQCGWYPIKTVQNGTDRRKEEVHWGIFSFQRKDFVITCGIFLLWLLTGWISKHAAAHFAWRLANQRLVCPRHTLSKAVKAVARAKTGPNSDTMLTTWTTWTISIHSLLRSHSRNSFCSAFLRSRRSLAWRSEAELLELSDWERKTQNVSSVLFQTYFKYLSTCELFTCVLRIVKVKKLASFSHEFSDVRLLFVALLVGLRHGVRHLGTLRGGWGHPGCKQHDSTITKFCEVKVKIFFPNPCFKYIQLCHAI